MTRTEREKLYWNGNEILNIRNVSAIAINPRTYESGVGGGGWLPPLRKHLRQHLKFSVAACLSLACVLRQVCWWSVPMDTRCVVISSRWSIHFPIDPGFHMVVPIVPIAPVISKTSATIRTSTGTISGFHTIVSIASMTRDAAGDVGDVSGSDNRIFARVSQTSQT